jgi:hypothetical protein
MLLLLACGGSVSAGQPLLCRLLGCSALAAALPPPPLLLRSAACVCA